MSVTTDRTPDKIIEKYLQFWSAATEEEQRTVAADVFTHDVQHHALARILHGVDEMVAFRAEFVHHVGQVEYRGRAAPDHHHDRARVPWEIVLVADGTSFADGTDILNLDADGRIEAISAFVDRLPKGFEEHQAE